MKSIISPKCEVTGMLCPVCGGNKKMKCVDCHGRGNRFSLWPSKSQLEICPRCEGLKEIVCPICKGEGCIEGDIFLYSTDAIRDRGNRNGNGNCRVESGKIIVEKHGPKVSGGHSAVKGCR